MIICKSEMIIQYIDGLADLNVMDP